MQNKPSTPALIRWLTSITRPVHPPLFASVIFRIISQSLDITIFATAGYTLAGAVTDNFSPALLGLIVLLALTRALAHYLEQFTGHYVAFKALEVLRGHAFATLWPKAPGVTLRQHSGSLLTGLTRDIDRIEVVYAHTFAPLISAVCVPALFLGTTGFTFGFKLVLIPLACVLTSVFLIPLIGFKTSLSATENTLAARADLTENLSDTVHGINEILTYGRQHQRLTEAEELGDAVLHSALPPARIKAVRRAANLALSFITLSSLLISAVGEQLEPVWTATLLLAATRLFEAPRGIENAASYLDYSFSAAGRLWVLTHSPASITDGHQELVLSAPPRLEWREVTYTHPGASIPTLAGLSFSAEAGEHTVLVGESGAGKSTALELLLRFDELDSGQILLDGAPITRYTADSLRAQVVLVSQTSQLLTGTIAENLRLGAIRASDAQLWQALETACLADEVRAMPDSLDTQVGVAGGNLSGGQVQRLTLARALLMEPRVLLLDEFTAHLNAELETEIRGRLSALRGKVTIVEVSHRTAHLLDADRRVQVG